MNAGRCGTPFLKTVFLAPAEGNITNKENEESIPFAQQRWRHAVGGEVCNSYPSCRSQSVGRPNDEKEADVRPTTSKCRHFTLTTIICAAALAVALFVSKIQIVFQLMGGTTSAFVCFILPAAFAIRLENTQRMQLSTGERIGSWCLAVGGVVVGVLSTFVTIYNLIEPNRHN